MYVKLFFQWVYAPKFSGRNSLEVRGMSSDNKVINRLKKKKNGGKGVFYYEKDCMCPLKIGKHYEIQKIAREDFILLAESVGIKTSVLTKIFEDFRKTYAKAFDELRFDKKASAEVLEKIPSVFEETIQKFLGKR